MCHDNEEWYAKTEEELTCQFKIDMRNLTNSDLSTQKSQKSALKLAAFDWRYIMLDLRKYRGVMFDGLQDW